MSNILNRTDAIKEIHAAAVAGDRAECMRLFSLGLVSKRIYKQILKEASFATKEKKIMTQNFALIDNCSGYVWGVYAAKTPESACAAADLDCGDGISTYESVSQLASNQTGYLIYAAPEKFTVNDGQAESDISAVCALPFVGKFRRVQ